MGEQPEGSGELNPWRMRNLLVVAHRLVDTLRWFESSHLQLGVLAQLGERLPCKQEVVGSIPIDSTICTHEGFDA